MEGVPQKGDHFGGDLISACAQGADGTLVLQIGTDAQAALPLKAGSAYKGQHALELTEE